MDGVGVPAFLDLKLACNCTGGSVYEKMTDTGRYIDIFTLIISSNTNERLRIHCCLERDI